jgi:hypothetical protein
VVRNSAVEREDVKEGHGGHRQACASSFEIDLAPS